MKSMDYVFLYTYVFFDHILILQSFSEQAHALIHVLYKISLASCMHGSSLENFPADSTRDVTCFGTFYRIDLEILKKNSHYFVIGSCLEFIRSNATLIEI